MRWNKRSKLKRLLDCLKPGMGNWSNEGGSVFLIMFKTRHALPLVKTRFSCPQTRPIRELESSAHKTRKRIVCVYARSASAFSPCQRACPLTARTRDIAMASTVRGLALHIDTKCPGTVRGHDLSTPANQPRTRPSHKLQLTRNSSRHRNVAFKSRPANFLARIQIIPNYEYV
jgi:hypothetical protein